MNKELINPIQLQRLVDGELGLDETRQILHKAERNPELWRLIGSTFVENQLWQSVFVTGQNQHSEAPLKNAPHRNSHVGHWTPIQWLSLAATVLLSVSIGSLVIDSGEVQPGVDSVAGNVASVPELESDERLQLADTASTVDLNQTPALYRMQLQDDQGNEFMDSELPLYSGRQADAERWMRDISSRSKSMGAPMVDSGYQLERNLKYLSGRLQDGRRVVIPVHAYEFTPGQ